MGASSRKHRNYAGRKEGLLTLLLLLLIDLDVEIAEERDGESHGGLGDCGRVGWPDCSAPRYRNAAMQKRDEMSSCCCEVLMLLQQWELLVGAENGAAARFRR